MEINNDQAYRDTVEYYRLTLVARRRDKHAPEAARADAEILAMVKNTPDLQEMTRSFLDGGLSFRLTRAMAVDGARYQAEVHAELGEEEPAEHWRRRAEAIAGAADYEALNGIAAGWGEEEAKLREKLSRTETLVEEAIEETFFISAAKPGSELSASDLTKLEAGLKELSERHPGRRLPDLLTLPYIRPRLAFDDNRRARFVAIFERVNAECLGGRY